MDKFSLPAGVVALPDLALIALSGPEAAKFLHSQLSNSVLALAPHAARPAAYCSAQGRVLANPLVFAHGERIFLLLAADLAESVAARLRMFVLRAKLQLELAPELRVYAVFGAANIPATLAADPWAALHDPRGVWVRPDWARPSAELAYLISPEDDLQNLPPAAAGCWNALRVGAGWPIISQASSEKFLPAALAMDTNGTVDFKKGCYPGQEIIARSHYRGVSKRSLQILAGAGAPAEPPAPLSDIYAAAAPEEALGRVVEAALWNDEIVMAAELPSAKPADPDEGYLVKSSAGAIFLQPRGGH